MQIAQKDNLNEDYTSKHFQETNYFDKMKRLISFLVSITLIDLESEQTFDKMFFAKVLRLEHNSDR